MKQKIIKSLVGAFSAILLLIVIIVVILTSIIVVLFGGGEEEEVSESAVVIYEDSPLSDEVEALRDVILKELKKYGKEEYINLLLAVVMQESGGRGEDVFKCSESLGLAANSISKEKSIEHGTKVLCNLLDHEKIKVSSPEDIEHIKIALQAYNYSSGYITYINDTSRFGRDTTKAQMQNVGKWTQENALAYQKKMATKEVRGYIVENKRKGNAAALLGPYAYGDAYYTSHVLRYYVYGNKEVAISAKAGEAAKVKYEDKFNFLWPDGKLPTSKEEAGKYTTTITVPIINEKGNAAKMNLTVHSKLAEEYKAIFNEMYKIKFPIKSTSTAAFVWKVIDGTTRLSQHSYGVAIDVNWNDNPLYYTTADVSNGYSGYQPGKNKYSLTKKVINIWKSHGFYWGGDWPSKKDTMHFSYTEKP